MKYQKDFCKVSNSSQLSLLFVTVSEFTGLPTVTVADSNAVRGTAPLRHCATAPLRHCATALHT